MPSARSPQDRPLSPHLQIYRPMLTMIMSIVHRLTGAGLYLGTALLVWWLLAVATGPGAYDVFVGFIGSIFGRLILFGVSWALIHHMLGGVKHLIWDTGHGFDLNKAEWMARLSLAGSIILTLVIWIIGYANLGA